MALPSSGPVSLADVQAEFGGVHPIGMDEYHGVSGAPLSGTISFTSWKPPVQWSGSSLGGSYATNVVGIVTSGSSFRYEYVKDGIAYNGSTAWLTVSDQGVISTGTSYALGVSAYSAGQGLESGPNWIRAVGAFVDNTASPVYYTRAGGFTGTSNPVESSNDVYKSGYLTTSGGYLRIQETNVGTGAWIRLA